MGGSETCCCLEGEFCCKPGADMLCLGCCACRCIAPSTCMKSENQCCCTVAGIAIPCDDEVPCMLACCFLDCYPKCGCCQNMGDLMAKGNAQGGTYYEAQKLHQQSSWCNGMFL